MTITELVSDADMKKHHCLETVDQVAGDSETTKFKRRARLQQALWRERKHSGIEIGTQPMRPKPGATPRPLGSRIAVDAARKSEANFLSDTVRSAVRHRLGNPEPHQTLNEDRLYCDLLSSMPMCFNLFGILRSDLELANRAVHAWWPDVPGRVCAVRFEWSPGRSLPGQFLENRSAFDVAFELDLPAGGRGVIGVETKYHEDCKSEKPPVEKRLQRYKKVTSESGIFVSGALDKLVGTRLQQIWLDHLLALSMLQHTPPQWNWARFVLVHPARNPSYARAAREYAQQLTSSSNFEVRTIESLLENDALPADTISSFRERYLW